jgi:membrane protease YdiL (CAAX protease family)
VADDGGEEETAFRGVLSAMLARRRGGRAAITGSSLLFGLCTCCPPSGCATPTPPSATDRVRPGTGRSGLAVRLAVVGATLAGVALCELGRRCGSLLPPLAVPWALLDAPQSGAVERL